MEKNDFIGGREEIIIENNDNYEVRSITYWGTGMKSYGIVGVIKNPSAKTIKDLQAESWKITSIRIAPSAKTAMPADIDLSVFTAATNVEIFHTDLSKTNLILPATRDLKDLTFEHCVMPAGIDMSQTQGSNTHFRIAACDYAQPIVFKMPNASKKTKLDILKGFGSKIKPVEENSSRPNNQAKEKQNCNGR